MTPYYQDDLVTIWHGDCREWMPEADVIVTDPPWGVSKRPRTYHGMTGPAVTWDGEFMLPALPTSAQALCLLPGIANLLRCPDSIGGLTYRWTLSAWVGNGMTRSPVGYGNWIAALLYAADGVSIYRQRSDHGKVSISGPRPDHESPKPIEAMAYFVGMSPPGTILDPYAGSGSTLLAARQMGRKAIGIEIEERYCEVAANRCRQEVLGLAS